MTRHPNPAVNEWVCVRRYPTRYGPAKPPRFPTELMSPIEAAAAELLKMVLGSAQKLGCQQCTQAACMVKRKSCIQRGREKISPSIKVSAPMKSGKAVCQRLSPP